MASPASPSSRRASRLAAATIDAALAVVLAYLLASTLGMFFARRAVVTLRIGDPGTYWQGPVPMVLGAVGEITYGLPFAVWLSWMLNPLTGATIGERVCGLRVVRDNGAAAATGRRWARTLVLTSGSWGWMVALLLVRPEIAVAATASAIVVGSGLLLALGRRGRALHDRIAGTKVA